MAAIQLNFTLRTSGNVKTVHLAGSWDNYTGQLPLSKDSQKSGGWKSTFRFPATTMKQGQRYWYYYILDGYHPSHDPARDSVVEPTTGRRLNVLDIPASSAAPAPSSRSSTTSASRRDSRHLSLAIPRGRPLPSSSIVSPTPVKPGQQTRQIRAEEFSSATLEGLAARFAAHRVSAVESLPSSPVSATSSSESDFDSEDDDDSDIDSDVPSLTSSQSSGRSRASSPTSSVSSDCSRCSCERYGITRAGTRVRLDCGGKRCGFEEEEESDCSEEEEEEEDPKTVLYRRAALMAQQQRAIRRQGMVLR